MQNDSASGRKSRMESESRSALDELLREGARRLLQQAIEQEAVEHGWTILEKRIEPDHVVVVVETWPNHSPETVVRRFRDAAHATIDHPSSLQGGKLRARGYVATTDLEILDELVARLLSDDRADNS